MELNEYQTGAMSTCLPSCKNIVYMLNGLTAEVGEINDKVAKWVRKGIARIDNNKLVFNTCDENVVKEYLLELIKELGDCFWFIAGLSSEFNATLEEVAQINLDKLANRKTQGTLISHTDH